MAKARATLKRARKALGGSLERLRVFNWRVEVRYGGITDSAQTHAERENRRALVTINPQWRESSLYRDVAELMAHEAVHIWMTDRFGSAIVDAWPEHVVDSLAEALAPLVVAWGEGA